jgi:hypothetical protein
MKLLTDTEEQVVSGPTLGTLQLGISQDNFRLAMEILMDLYTQPIDSIMRELCSNAVDAMRQAGNEHLPIEVTLPSHLSPNLVVKDYGLGMSAEFITSTYCNLLSSTKRDDNDEIGGYGIGSKSPLGYTDSYTLSTRHAGTELHLHVSRNGGFVLLGSNPTTEGSGTTVTVPVKVDKYRGVDDCKAFMDAVSWLRYMSPPPLVNGKPIPQEEVLLEGEGWFIAKHDTPYESYMRVLLGPIPYYLDTSNLGQLTARQRCVATTKYFRLKLPIGSISVTPSRETLRYDERTVTTIKEALDDAYLRAMMAIKRLLESYEWAVDAKVLCDRQQFGSWFRASTNPSYYDKYTDSLTLPITETWYQFTYKGGPGPLSREKATKYPTYGQVEVYLHDSPQRSRLRMEAYLSGKRNTTLLVGPPDSQVTGMKLFPTKLLSSLPDVVRDASELEEDSTKPKKVLQRLDRGTMRARLWEYNANPDGRLLYAHTADTTIPLDGDGYCIVMHAGNVVHPHLYEHRKLEYNNIGHMQAVLGIVDAPLYVVTPQGRERLGTGYKDIITSTHDYLSPWLPWIKQLHEGDTMARTFYGTNAADWDRYGVGGYLLEYLKLATEVENLLKGKYSNGGINKGIVPGVLDLYQYYLPALWDAVPALPTNPLTELCYLVDKVYPLVHYMSRGSNDMKDYLRMVDTLLTGADGWYSSCKLTQGLPQPTMGGRELMEYYYQRYTDVRGYYERHG